MMLVQIVMGNFEMPSAAKEEKEEVNTAMWPDRRNQKLAAYLIDTV